MSSSLSFVKEQVLSCAALGRKKASFQSRARVAKENLLYPTPALVCTIGPSLPGTFPTECPVSSFKPRTNWMVGHPVTLFLEQLPAKSIPLQFLYVVVSHQVMSDS